jgi:hypothetical protein
LSLAVALTRAQEGVTAPLVTVEVHLSGGLPNTSIVGLPEAAVREARDRVRVAIQNTQFEYPNRRVTVNLAPAELPKDWNFLYKDGTCCICAPAFSVSRPNAQRGLPRGTGNPAKPRSPRMNPEVRYARNIPQPWTERPSSAGQHRAH